VGRLDVPGNWVPGLAQRRTKLRRRAGRVCLLLLAERPERVSGLRQLIARPSPVGSNRRARGVRVPLWIRRGWKSDLGFGFRSARACVHQSSRVFPPRRYLQAAICRHLLAVTAPCDDPVNRYLGVFDAPNPWGPWTTVAYLEQWGAPENRFQPQIPAKWIESDGLSFYLQYSCFPNGPYRFNAQRASLILR